MSAELQPGMTVYMVIRGFHYEGSSVQSIHLSEKGAWRAVATYTRQARKEWHNRFRKSKETMHPHWSNDIEWIGIYPIKVKP